MSAFDPSAAGLPIVPGAGGSLPTATGAGEVPVSDGAGTDYTATAAQTVVEGAIDTLYGTVPAADFLVGGSGAAALASSVAPAVRTVIGAAGVTTYTLDDFTGVAGANSAPTDQGSGVWRFSVGGDVDDGYYGGSYTYDGTLYAGLYNAPSMTLAMPSGLTHLDARVRIVTSGSATSGWEMPLLLLRAGSTLLHGIGIFGTGEVNDTRGGSFLSTYPTTGTAPSTAVPWTGTGWLRIVWTDGTLRVYTGTGSGTTEPTAWEQFTSAYIPAGAVASAPTLVVVASRPTSSTNPAGGGSGTFGAWTVDLQANVYVTERP